MTGPNFAAVLAGERHHDMIKAAERGRLAKLARCCKPSNLIAATHALHTRLTRHVTPPAART